MIAVDCEQDKELFEKIATATEKYLSLSGGALVEVEVVSEQEIHELNMSERHVDKATDVLSFPTLTEITEFTEKNYPFDYDHEIKAVRLGSIVICESIAAAQADEYGHTLTREKGYLFLHGLLHLLGYDHIEEDDKAKMRDVEEGVLTSLGLTRGL